jgi:hypothetical protein
MAAFESYISISALKNHRPLPKWNWPFLLPIPYERMFFYLGSMSHRNCDISLPGFGNAM